MGDECEMCPNCKRDIPLANYRMHTLHCSRNVIRCKKCDEPVPRSMLEEHEQEQHTDKECEMCKAKVKPGQMEHHKQSECEERMIRCQYCELDIRGRDIVEHEGYCGSRTEECPECGDYVKITDWEEHQKMTLYHELAKKPSSVVFGYNPLCPPIESTKPIIPTTTSTRKYSQPTTTKNSESDSLSYFSRKYSLGQPPYQSKSFEEAPLLDSLEGLPALETLPKNRKRDIGGYEGSTTKFGGLTFGPTSSSAHLDVTSLLGKSSNYDSASLMERERTGSSELPSPTVESKITTAGLIGSTTDSFADGRKRDFESGFAFHDGIEEETKIPCEFCEELIPILKLINHQTNCTRNMDSLYFNSHTPNPSQTEASPDRVERKEWPSVVQSALYGKESEDDHREARNSPPHLIDFGDDRSESPLEPPPLPPKTRIQGASGGGALLDFGGAKPKRKSSSISIVGKYVPAERNKNSSSRGASSGRSHSKKEKKLSFDLSHDENKVYNHREHDDALYGESSTFKSRSIVDTTKEIDRQTRVTQTMLDHDTCALREKPLSSTVSAPKPVVVSPAVLEDYMPPPRVLRNKEIVNPEEDMAEREKLRQMLSDLRKDPFDEDLENNDGSFFPCEFCGDPYPVEFLMRHQLSCDLNPTPVTSGQGFDYSLIRNRAAQNLELAKKTPHVSD